MTEFALIPDHTAQALGLLIDQFQGLPRFSGLVASCVNRIQEFEYALWDVVNKRLLDYTALDGTTAHAVAAQLDVIGRLVGRGRYGQDDATYLTYIRAQIFLNNSRSRRNEVIALLQLIESAGFSYTEFYPGVVYVNFLSATATAPSVLFDIARRAVTGGVALILVDPVPGQPTFHFVSGTSAVSDGLGFALTDGSGGGHLARTPS